MNRIARLGLALVLGAAGAGTASGTSYAKRSFEAIVQDAAFVGVVECVTAGVAVAEYRVLETWKGDLPRESLVRIRGAAEHWEPWFPLALVGERRVVAAHRSGPAAGAIRGTPPFRWRRLGSAWTMQYPQGEELLPTDPVSLGSAFGCDPCSVPQLEAAVRAFAAFTPMEQERAVVRRAARDILTRLSTEHPAAAVALEQIEGEASLEGIVERAVWFAAVGPRECLGSARHILHAGGARTVAIVEGLDDTMFRGGAEEHRVVLQRLRLELGRRANRSARVPEPWTREEVDAARERLGETGLVTAELLFVLAAQDPAAVVGPLIAWRNPRRSERDTNLGYRLGSIFGALCRAGAPAHLTRLLDAEDEEVRVAAAVYLAMHDEAAGAAHLEQFQSLTGDAGIWAALTLARRGHAASVPRALDSFGGELGTGADLKLTLRLRTLALLSNSAARAGVTPPPPVEVWTDVADVLAAWWDEVGDRCPPFDPWLEELAEQKID